MAKKFDSILKHLEFEGGLVHYAPPLETDLALNLATPQNWLPALCGPQNPAEQIRTLWAPLEQWLPRTIDAYAKNCLALAVVRTREAPLSILYCFDLGKTWTAMRGFAPNSALPEVSRAFPVDLTPLYALHNGLVNFASGEDGPLPIERWTLIEDPQRGGGLLEVLSEGGRGVGFDIGSKPVRCYRIDADDEDEPVTEIADPWAHVDSHLAKWLERRK